VEQEKRMHGIWEYYKQQARRQQSKMEEVIEYLKANRGDGRVSLASQPRESGVNMPFLEIEEEIQEMMAANCQKKRINQAKFVYA